jgi:hypothetical protein
VKQKAALWSPAPVLSEQLLQVPSAILAAASAAASAHAAAYFGGAAATQHHLPAQQVDTANMPSDQSQGGVRASRSRTRPQGSTFVQGAQEACRALACPPPPPTCISSCCRAWQKDRM